MASQPPSSSSTSIASFRDDLLREVFLRLPDLPTLVRAAFTCRAFRAAVRSSPSFRRSFRALHAPSLLAFLLEPYMQVIPAFPSAWRRRSDPDLVAAFCAADFFDIGRLSRDGQGPGWEIHAQLPNFDGYVLLVNGRTEQRAGEGVSYNPLTQSLNLFLWRNLIDTHFEFHTLPSEDDGQGPPSRVVCVRHDCSWTKASVAVFSSGTMEWQFFPRTTLLLREYDRAKPATVVRGLVCWAEWMDDQIVMLDTATFQFSLMDLPTPLKNGGWEETTFKLGETKDEKLCIVDIMGNTQTLVAWFLTAEDHGVVERWTMYRTFSLQPIVKEFTNCSIEEEVVMRVEAVIDGFVYLSIQCQKDTKPCQVFLSLCLETAEMNELFKDDGSRYYEEAHPYVMQWPPSLVQNKEESETEVTVDNVADYGRVGTKEASSVLVTALQSFKQALIMNDDEDIMAAVDAYLSPIEDDFKSSLMSKITALDAQLTTARDRILRISAWDEVYMPSIVRET
ncbi:uncharacterized protein LOC106865425 isoform X1 [Brachypodium distachyon]|uniref:F-box domain-containing protein n=1 Tax=Brachypodium distachyon TaxID=15368 RepID=A0A0Q3KM51_BRADI|nr:uncharacterized protein LOC106865425 isoform X1 [Brachypodium distachyon]XP_014753575.1 uncharacterized protein LOC106865425 isoform X1 [Brachypodium distachyon]XP_014753578.1 uncharacterized protein LOC106865425 isoform X1 [Brachypodium distachyon]KQK12201.1 hypothetical protein BRADI_1g02145v3 [Brachypodium distachyon]|eukprot:XP_014753574.1 uncharacterized protein LOC106865425 isoform X1 [Brachypodium distachyon]